MNYKKLKSLIETMRSQDTIPGKYVEGLLVEKYLLYRNMRYIYANRKNNVLASIGTTADLATLSTHLIEASFTIADSDLNSEMIAFSRLPESTITSNTPLAWDFIHAPSACDSKYEGKLRLKYRSCDTSTKTLTLSTLERQTITDLERSDVMFGIMFDSVMDRIHKHRNILHEVSIKPTAIDEVGHIVGDGDTKNAFLTYDLNMNTYYTHHESDCTLDSPLLTFTVSQKINAISDEYDGVTFEYLTKSTLRSDRYQEHAERITVTVTN